MMNCLGFLTLLAQAADGAGGAGNGGPPDFKGFLILMMGGLAILMIVQFLFGRSDVKEKAKREQFIGSLKKNDPVVTIGGILGNVVSVSEDKREVTIKVDDNT